MRIDIGKDAKLLDGMMDTIDRNLETWGHGIEEIDIAIAKKEFWDDIRNQVEMLASIPNDDTKIVYYGTIRETVEWMMKHDIPSDRVLSASHPHTLQGLNHIPTIITPVDLTVNPVDVEKFRQTDEQISYLVRLYSKED